MAGSGSSLPALPGLDLAAYRARLLQRYANPALQHQTAQIAMDALMVDVTDVSGAPVDVDDEFVLLGEQGGRTLSAAQLALAGTTISWEVLAGMARRVPRVYYAAATPVHIRTLTEEAGPWRGTNS